MKLNYRQTKTKLTASRCVSCVRGNVLAAAWEQSHERLYNVLTLDFFLSPRASRLRDFDICSCLSFALLFNVGHNEINIAYTPSIFHRDLEISAVNISPRFEVLVD